MRIRRDFPHPRLQRGLGMGKAAVGFYWTLPVPWAGFTDLPDGIEAAAKASRTIRYQCEAIRRHAKQQGYTLIAEEVFLEISPDRGSDIIQGPLRKIERLCRAQDAVLLYVDFSEVQGWRSHAPMTEWSHRTRISVEPIYPDEILIDAKIFDPHAHFADWRDKQHAWRAGKADRTAAARDLARRLRERGDSYPAIAAALTDSALPSATGKAWSAESVRKLLAVPKP
jgi:hypothetical protein